MLWWRVPFFLFCVKFSVAWATENYKVFGFFFSNIVVVIVMHFENCICTGTQLALVFCTFECRFASIFPVFSLQVFVIVSRDIFPQMKREDFGAILLVRIVFASVACCF